MKGSQGHQAFHRQHSENCCFECCFERVSLNWSLPSPPLHFGKCFYLSWTPCLPKLNWGPCPGLLKERTHPLESDARECSQSGKGGGGRCFRFGSGRVCTWGARPTHNLVDFVTQWLNMYSYPRQISDIVSKKNNIGPFNSHGLVHLTRGPQIMKSSPIQQNILWWKNCSMCCPLR